MSDQVSLQQHLETWAGTDELRAATASTVAALAAAAATSRSLVDGRSARRHTRRRAKRQQRRRLPDRARSARQRSAGARRSRARRSPPSPPRKWTRRCRSTPAPPSSSRSIRSTAPPTSTPTCRSAPFSRCCRRLPAATGAEPAAFLRAGREQVAAGYALYGPQTTLRAHARRRHRHLHARSRARRPSCALPTRVRVPARAREFAINASNYRHWDAPVRQWFDECLAGAEGPRGENFNMRWIASMVAEAHRILVRGGIYLYPGDAREGYRSGRLRLLYEANPIAFLMEQAGGCRLDRPRTHSRPRAAPAARTGAARVRRARGCRAHRAPSPRPRCRRPSARRCSGSAACSASEPRATSEQRSGRVSQASHHLGHRLLGRRHHLGAQDLRTDLPPRRDRGRLSSKATPSIATTAPA